MLCKLKLRQVLKHNRSFQIIIFLNGQLYYPYMSQVFTSLSQLVVKPKYDFWVH